VIHGSFAFPYEWKKGFGKKRKKYKKEKKTAKNIGMETR
jgi:hypothetical protein